MAISVSTDNIYKFVTGLGLLTLVGTIGASWTITDSTFQEYKAQQPRITKVRQETTRMLHGIPPILEEVKAVMASNLEVMQVFIGARNRVRLGEPAVIWFDAFGELQKMEFPEASRLDDIGRRLGNLDVRLSGLGSDVSFSGTDLLFLHARLNSRVQLMRLGFLIGLFLTAVGLVLWFRRTQVLEDRLKELQRDRAELEVQALRNKIHGECAA